MSRHSSRPSSDAPALRVLQLIGDTDETDEHLEALALHRQLSALGLQVRTLALGPGSTGGLDEIVPVISPGRRTFAARSQLGVEARWADVLCLHGASVLTPAALRRAGTSPPVVLATTASNLARPLRRRSAEGPIARRAVLVVVGSARDVQSTATRYGCDPNRVRVIEHAPGAPDLWAAAWVDALEEMIRDDRGGGGR